ncbi:hypothetical protein TRFO_28703 [Tritrichomonas foetus]|uniref:Uncharacterized protein n=1 Tax=Tritrichomonas foetus TaxID=1144522 RepID=A0A1J4K349_9EUKA|nr:hypothetical protein TRFO_28703 [Tritrichomonas foetus]|eukprot:OHT03925.1 hypothetical protein TRFO_28703 [Tritrichomonas foetus]
MDVEPNISIPVFNENNHNNQPYQEKEKDLIIDFAKIGFEFRRLKKSSYSIIIASFVINNSIIDKNITIEDFILTNEFQNLLKIALIIVKRFSVDPISEIQQLVSLAHWMPNSKHFGEYVFLQTILSNSDIIVESSQMFTILECFPTLFKPLLMSRIYSSPTSLCPNTIEKLSIFKLPTITYLKNGGCSLDFIKYVLECPFLQAFSYFCEGIHSYEIIPPLSSFLYSFPQYYSVIDRLIKEKESLRYFILRVIENNPESFFNSFILFYSIIPKRINEAVLFFIQQNSSVFVDISHQIESQEILINFLLKNKFDDNVEAINFPTHLLRKAQAKSSNSIKIASIISKKGKINLNNETLEAIGTQPISNFSNKDIENLLDQYHLIRQIIINNPNFFVDLLQFKPQFTKKIVTLQNNIKELKTNVLLCQIYNNDEQLFFKCVDNDLPSSLIRLVLRMANKKVVHFPSSEFFVKLCSNKSHKKVISRFIETDFQNIAKNKDWYHIIESVNEIFLIFVRPLSKRSIHDKNLVILCKNMLIGFLQKNYNLFADQFNRFIQFLQFLVDDEVPRLFRPNTFPKYFQLQLLSLLSMHSSKINMPDQRIACFRFLISMHYDKHFYVQLDPSVRNYLFSYVIINMLYNKKTLPKIDPTFVNVNKLLVALSDDPFHHERFTPNIKKVYSSQIILNAQFIRDSFKVDQEYFQKWMFSLLLDSSNWEKDFFKNVPEFRYFVLDMMLYAFSQSYFYSIPSFLDILCAMLMNNDQNFCLPKETLKTLLFLKKNVNSDFLEKYNQLFHILNEPRYIKSFFAAFSDPF